MSKQATVSDERSPGSAVPAASLDVSTLDDSGQTIVGEELAILERVRARVAKELEAGAHEFEDLDGQMIELRDEIASAKEEDLPSLLDQMHQLAALNAKRGSGRSLPVDPNNPYFGHLRLKEARAGK
ncbi:MAG TPA: hypothetical protein VK034_19560, partial [Enhygromyxa sp.]|nr:hypothetical protein [Enhygromyxa sp.]